MRNLKYRCKATIFNWQKKRYRRCNNCIYRLIDTQQLCWSHYNKQSKWATLTIQAAFRAYKSRRYLNIYKRLPDDIQIIIKRVISREYYERLYCKSIYRVLNNRYTLMNQKLEENRLLSILVTIDTLDEFQERFIQTFMEYMYPVYRLYNKYFEIVTIVKSKEFLRDLTQEITNLHNLSFPVLSIIRSLSKDYFYENNENNVITGEIYNKFLNSIFIINSLSERYETYFT
jgi:hypothetical protein